MLLATHDLDDRFLTLMEQVVELPQAKRDEVLDSVLDVIDPQVAPRPHANSVRVAEGRAILAAYDRGFTAALDEIEARRDAIRRETLEEVLRLAEDEEAA